MGQQMGTKCAALNGLCHSRCGELGLSCGACDAQVDASEYHADGSHQAAYGAEYAYPDAKPALVQAVAILSPRADCDEAADVFDAPHAYGHCTCDNVVGAGFCVEDNVPQQYNARSNGLLDLRTSAGVRMESASSSSVLSGLTAATASALVAAAAGGGAAPAPTAAGGGGGRERGACASDAILPNLARKPADAAARTPAPWAVSSLPWRAVAPQAEWQPRDGARGRWGGDEPLAPPAPLLGAGRPCANGEENGRSPSLQPRMLSRMGPTVLEQQQ